MSSTIDRHCPKCKQASTTEHCILKGCPWRTCECKSTYAKFNKYKIIIFDQDGKYFGR